MQQLAKKIDSLVFKFMPCWPCLDLSLWVLFLMPGMTRTTLCCAWRKRVMLQASPPWAKPSRWIRSTRGPS